MSMIESQIKRLEALIEGMKLDEKLGRVKCSGFSLDNRVKIINDAISTIRDLSAKLAAANMERSTVYYNGGWIPTDEALPENWERVLIQFEKANWGTGDIEIFLHIAELDDDGEWVTACGTPNGKVTAWMPLPESYKKEV